MIRTRILVGTLMALGAAGVLIGDTLLAQQGYAWFPCLFVFTLLAGLLGTREMVRLFPSGTRPAESLTLCGVLLLLSINWYPTFPSAFIGEHASVWTLLVFVFVGVLVAAFLMEMKRFTGEPGAALPRLSFTLLTVAYLGLLPCFFVQVRWLSPDPYTSAVMLALVVFVPKGNDIGAFFTGTFLGKHRMTPLLSPKKTWQGFTGGMLTGAAVALGLSLLAPIFQHGILEAVGFGLVVGGAGVLGDLAESLIKRDCQIKDASLSIPGFGGVLDVTDSVLFAAPAAYLWLLFSSTGT